MEWEKQGGMAELRRFFAETEGLIREQLFPLARSSGNQEAMEALRQVWLRLQQGPVRVLFLGVSSAGKSTLINAMVGNVVVPEGHQTTSPVPVWIHSSESALKTPDIRLVWDAGWEELPELKNVGGAVFVSKYCYTSREAASDAARKKYQGLIAASVDVRFQPAPDSGLTLIDAPGINASVGDNLRVEDVLKQGCEMVAIVFKEMNQSAEEYLQHLLVEEDGPLHSLLESGRVFAVHNWVTPGTKANAKAHLKKVFGEALAPSRFYMLNAFQNRQVSAGLYDYQNFLQEGASDEEKQEARAGYQNEEKKLEELEEKLNDEKSDEKKRALRRDLDRLWADLQERRRQMTGNPEELEEIIAPIRAGVNRAIELLEQKLDQDIQQIRKSNQGSDQKKVLRYADTRRQLEKLRGAEERMAGVFSDTDENSLFSKWIKETRMAFPQLLSFMKAQPELQGYRLVCEKNSEVNQVLLEGIEGSNWVSILVDGLFPYRAAAMKPAFLNTLLGDAFREKLQAFTQIFRQKFQEADRTLEELDVSVTVQQESEEETARKIWALHEKAARQAEPAFSLNLEEETRETLRRYLADKQARINSGKFLSRLTRSFLSTNLEVDQLNPYVRGVLERSMDRYAEAMGFFLRAAVIEERDRFKRALENKHNALEEQSAALDKEIQAEREAWRQQEIRKVEERRRQLRAMRLD